MLEIPNSSYDPIAGLYNKLWADWYLPAALPALESLFFSRVPVRSYVLDLCCGSGQVTRELVRRGYSVVGIDASPELIKLARQAMPTVNFQVEDACKFQLSQPVDAALSTFDSLNHILQLADLKQVFVNAHRALKKDGLFVFDMNLHEAYTADLQRWVVNLDDTNVSLVRGSYNPSTQLASTELIWFIKSEGSDCWRQNRSVVEQRCFEEADFLESLAEAGFRDIKSIPGPEAGLNSELEFGRIFVSSRA